LGKIQKEPLVSDDNSIIVGDVVNINFTIDERIADGVGMAKALGDFCRYMENPELLE
jgi:pyruvate/2-oxoglutarate dehydrogenase complex dihydrolipoamide acyltransferase (E2) component